MALLKSKTEEKPQEEQKGTEIAKQGGTALPAYLQDYKGPTGTEDIDNADVTIPRLKIGQAISDEVKTGALKEGALYLNITGQSIWSPGDPPLMGLIVAHSKEYILWKPRKDGGGMLARAKPVKVNGVTRYKWDKPNQSFDVKIDGKIPVTWETKEYVDQDGLGDWGSEIPENSESGVAATAHHNYLIYLPSAGNVVAAVSLARSGVKVAKNLNAVLKMANANIPLAVRKFNITTFEDVGSNGEKFMNWNFKPAGLLGDDQADIARQAMEFFKNFREGGYTVDQSDGGAGESTGGGGEKDDEIPF